VGEWVRRGREASKADDREAVLTNTDEWIKGGQMYASAASVRVNEIQNGVQCFSISSLHQTPWFPRGMHAHILLVPDCRIALPLSMRPADEEIEYLFVATLVTIPKLQTFFFILDYG
jgi:hypothetical protein